MPRIVASGGSDGGTGNVTGTSEPVPTSSVASSVNTTTTAATSSIMSAIGKWLRAAHTESNCSSLGIDLNLLLSF